MSQRAKPAATRTAAPPAPASMPQPPTGPIQPLTPVEPAPPKERYFWVEWGPKAHKHDAETIRLWVNGVGRRWNRGVAVIAPESYLKAADNAMEPRFSMMPGEPLKHLSPMPRAPYKIRYDMGSKGEATEQEFAAQLAKGTAARKAAMPSAANVLP